MRHIRLSHGTLRAAHRAPFSWLNRSVKRAACLASTAWPSAATHVICRTCTAHFHSCHSPWPLLDVHHHHIGQQSTSPHPSARGTGVRGRVSSTLPSGPRCAAARTPSTRPTPTTTACRANPTRTTRTRCEHTTFFSRVVRLYSLSLSLSLTHSLTKLGSHHNSPPPLCSPSPWKHHRCLQSSHHLVKWRFMFSLSGPPPMVALRCHLPETNALPLLGCSTHLGSHPMGSHVQTDATQRYNLSHTPCRCLVARHTSAHMHRLMRHNVTTLPLLGCLIHLGSHAHTDATTSQPVDMP